MAFLNLRGDSITLFDCPLFEIQSYMAEAAKFCCLLGWEHALLIQLHLHQLSVFDSFLYCLSLAVLKFGLQTTLASNLEIY